MAKPTITCLLTGSVGPAINAHVIPRSFYKFNGNGQLIYLGEDSYRKKRAPIGIYDQTIVTQQGEDQFKDCDDYGAEFFVRNFDSKPWKILQGDNPANPHGKILEPGEFDPDMIRRLCMTILWRAHASSQDFFKKIDIGSHEGRLRNFILNGQLGDPSDFSIILSRWKDTSSAPTIVPQRVRFEGINYAYFKTSAFNFLIKVDSRSFEPDLLPIVVGGDSHLAVLQLEFFNSKDGRILIPLLRKHKGL
ncbi:MAG: hypothetical protein WCS43_11700 [Verrucomicrobiota bacterium]